MDGKYELLVRSQDGDVQASPRHIYKVVIAPEKPDFRLIVMPPDDHRPDAGRLYKGGNVYVSVLVWRQDGFAGPVTIAVEGLPAGVTCAPQTVGPDQKHAAMVLSAAAGAATAVAPDLKFKGTAIIGGKSEVREARPACITWPTQPQQNIPTAGRSNAHLPARRPRQRPVQPQHHHRQPGAEAGRQGQRHRQADAALARPEGKRRGRGAGTAPHQRSAGAARLHHQQQPADSARAGKDEFKAVLDVKPTMGPGTFNLVVKGSVQVPYNKDPMAKQKPNINIVQASTPVTISIAPKQLGTVTLVAANVTVKQGANAEVMVKVARLFDYDGEYKVKVMLPPNANGVTCDEVTIPAGQSEGKLMVRATDAAAIMNFANLSVVATAMYEGKTPITQEAKLSVNVVKK